MAVPVRRPCVRRVVQHRAERRGGPHGPPTRAFHAVGIETPRELADRVATSDVIVEDTPHHRRLGLVDFEVGRDVPAPGNAPVAVRDLGEDRLAGPHLVELAPTLPLCRMGPFVLGYDALHLDEQPCLGVVEGRRVDEAQLDTEPGKLVHHEHLVCEVARQAVRRQAPDALEHACFGLVPQRVEAWAVEAGTRVAVIDETADELVAFAGGSLLEGLELGSDRASLRLGFRRHPGIYSSAHAMPPLPWLRLRASQRPLAR